MKNTNSHIKCGRIKCVLTLRDFCRMPMGKSLMGSVVSQRRKSGWGLVILSSVFSRSFSHFTNRWQFCSISHWPRATAVSNSWNANYKRNNTSVYFSTSSRVYFSIILLLVNAQCFTTNIINTSYRPVHVWFLYLPSPVPAPWQEVLVCWRQSLSVWLTSSDHWLVLSLDSE